MDGPFACIHMLLQQYNVITHSLCTTCYIVIVDKSMCSAYYTSFYRNLDFSHFFTSYLGFKKVPQQKIQLRKNHQLYLNEIFCINSSIMVAFKYIRSVSDINLTCQQSWVLLTCLKPYTKYNYTQYMGYDMDFKPSF